jgi:hypothetical protein
VHHEVKLKRVSLLVSFAFLLTGPPIRFAIPLRFAAA